MFGPRPVRQCSVELPASLAFLLASKPEVIGPVRTVASIKEPIASQNAKPPHLRGFRDTAERVCRHALMVPEHLKSKRSLKWDRNPPQRVAIKRYVETESKGSKVSTYCHSLRTYILRYG
jgi:hypothetical protein